MQHRFAHFLGFLGLCWWLLCRSQLYSVFDLLRNMDMVNDQNRDYCDHKRRDQNDQQLRYRLLLNVLTGGRLRGSQLFEIHRKRSRERSQAGYGFVRHIRRKHQNDFIQNRRDFLRRIVAIIRLFLQKLLNYRVQTRRLHDRRRKMRRHLVHLLDHQIQTALARKRKLTDKHLIENNARRIQIRAIVDFCAVRLLRRNILRRAVNLTALR